MATASEDLARGMQLGLRYAEAQMRKEEAEKDREFRKGESEKDRKFRKGESRKDRKSSRKESKKDRESRADEGTKDRDAREAMQARQLAQSGKQFDITEGRLSKDAKHRRAMDKSAEARAGQMFALSDRESHARLNLIAEQARAAKANAEAARNAAFGPYVQKYKGLEAIENDHKANLAAMQDTYEREASELGNAGDIEGMLQRQQKYESDVANANEKFNEFYSHGKNALKASYGQWTQPAKAKIIPHFGLDQFGNRQFQGYFRQFEGTVDQMNEVHGQLNQGNDPMGLGFNLQGGPNQQGRITSPFQPQTPPNSTLTPGGGGGNPFGGGLPFGMPAPQPSQPPEVIRPPRQQGPRPFNWQEETPF